MSASSGNFPLTFRLQVQGDAEVTNKLKQVAAGMNQVAPAAQKVAQSSGQASTALKTTGQAATQSSTGLKSYSGALTSLGSSHNQAKSGVDAFSGSLGQFNTTNKATVGGLNETNTVTQGLIPTVGKLGTEGTKTQSKMQKLTDVFRGNKGLIFSTTMLTSGVIEAIGMYQGWQDASEKLTAAKEKEADLLERGLENTKEYGDAVKDVSDAQRGYNFITRFTIQSFADLIPMSLMLTSSLLEMTSRVGGLSNAKTKLAGVGSKVVSAFSAMGAASWAFIKTPIGITVTALSAIFIAFATNAGGVRDRINELGVALGNAVPGLKGLLDWVGQIVNGFSNTAASAVGMGTQTKEALVDVEAQVLKTGDATKLSIEEQIVLYNKLGKEGETVSFSLSKYLKMQADAQADHNKKYKEFVSAIQSGNKDIMQSLGLTAEEYEIFFDEWKKEIDAFDTQFGAFVDTIVQNYKSFGESAREAQESQGEELDKLFKKLAEHQAKYYEIQEKDKKSRKEAKEDWETTNDEILASIAKVGEGMSSMAIEARQDWVAFSEAGKTAMKLFKLEAVGGDFNSAIEAIKTAMDDAPEKYKGNFNAINSIIQNGTLTAEQKADIFVANMDKMDPFKSFIVGAHEYTKAQAMVTSGLDELAVAARANVTDMSQMDEAWNQFVGSLKPAQKALPIVQSAIAGVDSKAISAATAFGMVEAAGITMSEAVGGTVTKSFEELQKVVVDLPNDMTAVFANIGGQMVKVGEVTDQSLVSGPTSAVQSMKKTETQSATLATAVKTNVGTNATASVNTFATGATTAFDTVVKAFQAIPTALQKLPELFKTAMSPAIITKAWDNFRNALGEGGEWINQGITKIAGQIKSAMTIDNFIDSWNGFWSAIAEGTDVIVSGIATLAKTIASDIKAKALSQKWWQGFWDAMSATVTWVAGGVQALGTAIAKSIVTESPKWWKGFQDAFASTAQWVGNGVKAIGDGITKTITVANAFKWWKGFQDALGSTTTWVAKQMANVAKAILDFDWTALGAGIWDKISKGISGAVGSLGQGATDLGTMIQKGLGIIPSSFNTGGSPFQVPPGTIVNETGAPVNQQPGQDQQQQAAAYQGLLPAIKQLQAAISTLSTSVATYAKSMTTNMGVFFTKMGQAFPLLDTMIKTHQATWSGFSTSLATYANSATTNVGIFFTKMGQAFPMLDQIIKTHQATWSSFSTSLATYASSATANIGVFFTKMGQAFPMLDGIIKAHQGTWSAFSTSIATYANSMAANVTNFGTKTQAAMNMVASATKAAQSQLSQMSTSVSTYMSGMTSKVNSFGSAAQSSFKKVESSAKTATAAVKQLQSAINSLKDKSITIHVGLSGPGVGYLEHGGGFIRGLEHGGSFRRGQSGFSGIVDRPTTMNGVHMGEGFAPELVTVTPLTRGTGNHGGPTVSSGGGRGSGGGSITIEVPVIIDGRVFGRAVKKVSLEDIGLQV